MLKQKTFYILLVIGLTALNAAAQTDKRIAAIRELYAQTNAKVAECEENGDVSSTYLTELVVNKNNGSYPAVGIYQTVAKFYYTYGDREKNPYPNRLLKIVVETKRSDRVERSEFLFNEGGQMVFYFEAKDGSEKRVYFANQKPFRILDGEKSVEATDKPALELIKSIQTERRKLQTIFASSLDF